MKVTMKQVAEEAGVSIATVSFIVNGKADEQKIPEQTIRHIEEVVERLHYRPSPHARALHRGKTETIGVLVCGTELVASEMYGSLISNLTKHFCDYNINTMLLMSEMGSATVPKMIRERHVDGVVLVEHIPELVHRDISNLKMPMVSVNGILKPCNCVNINDYEGMKMAISHLYQLGHRRICYVDMRRREYDHISSHERRRGYIDFMKKYGLKIPYPIDNPPTDSHDSIGKWVYNVLTMPEEQRPTAVITYEDKLWPVVAKLAASLGILIPRDLSFVTFNDRQIAMCSLPALTSIDVRIGEMGVYAAEMINKLVYGGFSTCETVILTPRLIVRESTAKNSSC